eukprot:CAMPEP_0179442406 /NCGR_PEP_ID=MMETSP0799-20121207/25934_1 /TAXON_ID=46947 /ORGANISM="Geminigera cryophila, Strain CCMP2564" /LENGTH=148 /DNA_ID=CAMNT_0021227581 /DNA_START=81 /DNA_END=527 /DNA_ORIENTATION=+
MPPLNLAFLNKVRVSFCPFFNVAACREFVQRVETRKAMESNPKCEVKIEVIDYLPNTTIAPEIELEFRNGEIKKILPDKKMKIEDIQKIIMAVSTELELKEQYAEMKAAPVTGPIPISWFKGRRNTYAVYGEDEGKDSKRAKGGVKTK